MGTNSQAEKLRNWEGIIQRCEASGETVGTWCRSHQISAPKYYWWRKRIKQVEEAGNKAEFAELKAPESREGNSAAKDSTLPPSTKDPSPITLYLGQARLEIPTDVEAGALETILRVVRAVC